MKLKSAPRPDGFIDIFLSPLGKLFLLFSGGALAAIEFERPSFSLPSAETAQSRLLKKQLGAYFDGRLMSFDLEIEFLGGTEFEREVWHALREVPYGETRSYKWLAERIGRPKAVRAVGQALGKNPIPIVIPCHRIIESDGSLGGYTGGTDIKRRLLDLEYYAKQSAG